ncbi:MAG TPA: hypothetical protein VF627_15010, partial [Abditibacterium sp.]
QLPGTTETNKKGTVRGPGWTGQLTRVYKFEGPAYYQREITVPANWANKRVSLYLERTKPTQVWIDGRALGENVLLTAPHEYTVGNLTPGTHRLTVLVDNSVIPIPGDMHQLSDNTQGNWNGILGKIELRATDAVWLEDVQLYPDAATKTVRVRAKIGNASGQSGSGTVSVSAKGNGVSGATRRVPISWNAGESTAQFDVPLGTRAALWSEWKPNLHEMTLQLRGAGVQDERKVSFGLRRFTSGPQGFAINGRPTFLRGKHDAAVFPLTGHPPMDVAGWRRYLQVCKDFGINHLRFHTNTPPEAAFTAADEMGVYLQPEIPFWGDFTEDIKTRVKPEGEAIMRAFGNHPSFVMFALGNENRNSREIMGSLVTELRALDPRHLYAQGSNNFAWDPQLMPTDDFLVSARVKNSPQSPSRNVRGSHATVDAADGHVQVGPANTLKDYSEAISGLAKPAISHETGQYTTFPDFKEIPKYTGVMRAHNLEIFRKKLVDAGMIDQVDDFALASDVLSMLCYREEIETALRTPRMGGFDLLDLQDFPGQGTALVGMVNALLEPKPGISAAQFRQFCAPTVLLARFPKYGWTNNETLTATLQVAHYGEADLPRARLSWTLRDAAGKVVRSGKMPRLNVMQGGVRELGLLSLPLAGLQTPSQLKLELALDGTAIKTSYPLWIYGSQNAPVAPQNVAVAKSFDADTRARLARGERVFLVLDGQKQLAHTVGGGFATDFWNFPMFHNKPGTMGLLTDPKTPALASFPTEMHSNWQWFDIAFRAQPLVLDATPQGYRPIVQVIDNMERNHRLGLVFEFKVGNGRLLVCASDLTTMQDKPEARQLMSSLMSYAASEKFNPQTEMTPDALSELFLTAVPMIGKPSASS